MKKEEKDKWYKLQEGIRKAWWSFKFPKGRRGHGIDHSRIGGLE